MPAQPQDHKPAKGKPFRFTDASGKSHTLPSAAKGRDALTGRDLREAALGGEIGQFGYLIKALEAAGPTQRALGALYDLPQQDMIDILGEWADHGDGDGASLGE